MKPNTLYHFIHREIVSRPGSAPGTRVFAAKTSKEGKSYLLSELPLPRAIVIAVGQQKYSLNSHHLSIYSLQDDNNHTLSQYHYTAYFRDKKNNAYQLHAYFNQNDQLAAPVVLTLLNEIENNAPVTLGKELIQLFTQLAISQTTPVIAALRSDQQTVLAALKKRFDTLEQQLTNLSIDMVQNKNNYLIILAEAITVLDSLSAYTDEEQNYASILKLFRLIRTNLDTPVLATATQEEVATSTDTAQEQDEPAPVKRSNKKPVSPLIGQATNTFTRYQAALSKASSPQKVAGILEMNRHVGDLLIAADDPGYTITALDYQHITSFLSAYKQAGKQLLSRLLMNNEFELAAQLRQLVNPAPTELVTLALKTGNAAMLDFLLEHGAFAINTFIVQDQLTPVLYCFEKSQNTAAVVAMNKCLSVLLKHHASLMVNTADGFSVAYHIAVNPSHPLLPALRDTFIDSAALAFFENLVQSINNYLAAGNVSADISNRLKNDKKQFVVQIETLRAGKGLSTSTQKASLSIINNAIADVSQNLSLQNMQARLRLDSDYLKIDACFNAVAEKLPARIKNQCTKKGLEIIKNIDFSTLTFASYEDFKSQAIEETRTAIINFERMNALNDVQQRIRRSGLSRKEMIACRKLEQELIAEINGNANPPQPAPSSPFRAELATNPENSSSVAKNTSTLFSPSANRPEEVPPLSPPGATHRHQ